MFRFLSVLFLFFILFLGACKKQENSFGPGSFTTCDVETVTETNNVGVVFDSAVVKFQSGRETEYLRFVRDYSAGDSVPFQIAEHLQLKYNGSSELIYAVSVLENRSDTTAYFQYEGGNLSRATFISYDPPFSQRIADYSLIYEGDQVKEMTISGDFYSDILFYSFFYTPTGTLDYFIEKSDPNQTNAEGTRYTFEYFNQYKNNKYLSIPAMAMANNLDIYFFIENELRKIVINNQGELSEIEFPDEVVSTNLQGYVTSRQFGDQGVEHTTYRCR